jgi:hypothetical protein
MRDIQVSARQIVGGALVFVAGTALALAHPAAAATRDHDRAAPTVSRGAPAPRDFEFLVGSWKVRHRRLKARLVGSNEWEEFGGTLVNWTTMDGAGNVGDNVMERPGATIRGVGIRAYDVKNGQWLVWWLSASDPDITAPLRGSFKDGVGTFLGEDSANGKSIKVRARWSRITSTSAHWEQASSADGGATWEVNWTSDFTRVR